MGRRGPKPTRPWDMQVFCAIWQDADFTSLTLNEQMAVYRSVAQLGMDCSLGGNVYRAADLAMDELTFQMVAPGPVRIGVWTWVDHDAVEVWPYKDLIVPMPRRSRPRMPFVTRLAVLERDGHACRRCGAVERLEIDHVYPYSKGGGQELSNLQVLCRKCNWLKGAKV